MVQLVVDSKPTTADQCHEEQYEDDQGRRRDTQATMTLPAHGD